MTTTTEPTVDPHLGPAGGPGPNSHKRTRRTPAVWCADRRWRTLLATIAVLVGAVLLLGPGMRSTNDEDQLVGDSRTAEKAVAAADFGDRPTENVVISARDGELTKGAGTAVTKGLGQVGRA